MTYATTRRIATLVVVGVTVAAVGLFVHVARARAYEATALRVCADPNNLPFSNEARTGFENEIALLVGEELKRPVEYLWWAQRRGFVRNTLNTGDCDLVLGTASGMEMLSTTRPYYKSTYVFVTRRDRHLNIRSFDDSLLHRVKVGVQLIGDDFANTPPVHALANRGIVRNVVGFPVYGDYAEANPSAKIVNAVATGAVDVAVVWGPLAGYFAKQATVPLEVVPVSPRLDLPYLPFVFDIAMGVRRGDSTFRKQLDEIIVRRKVSIDSILTSYGVPLVRVAP
ncbi:MAG TPA: substrate-binding domain-containing protein [Gemmatimonadaceae bacterium]|jgi:quinoprotein dehydrogenase-associated probable ABC transporter substrate-binding protein